MICLFLGKLFISLNPNFPSQCDYEKEMSQLGKWFLLRVSASTNISWQVRGWEGGGQEEGGRGGIEGGF